MTIKYLNIYRLSVIYQFEKKKTDTAIRIHYRNHACISMYNLSENRKHSLHIRQISRKFRNGVDY